MKWYARQLIDPGFPGIPDRKRQAWVHHRGRSHHQQPPTFGMPAMMPPYFSMQQQPPMPMPMPGPMGLPVKHKLRGPVPPGYNNDNNLLDEAMDEEEDENMYGARDIARQSNAKKRGRGMLRQMQQAAGLRGPPPMMMR
ncbi:hypothetical protein LTR37_007178 [Vermiconidia calcicola]|uniref:Uncharacterized protein n=1 Tax=Vermiconidia calcicola TaxID=1690605 RepID=A0ACC3NEQ4_9PEZI|nr:hypothetical protein LTR37_007178 [Vermiconidia calcicola]